MGIEQSLVLIGRRRHRERAASSRKCRERRTTKAVTASILEMAILAARELNKGPSPSEASVDDGAETEFLRKMPLPTLKSSSRLKSILPEDSEKAFGVSVEPREVARRQASPHPARAGESGRWREQAVERGVGAGAICDASADQQRQAARRRWRRQ